MNLDFKDDNAVNDEINGNEMKSIDEDILYDVFNEISSNSEYSDKYALNLTDFICGLIKFGINTLSNKEMENIFNLMGTNNQNTITAIDFINFLTKKYDEINDETKDIQFILLNKIYENIDNDNIGDDELCISDYFEFSYNPSKSTQCIFDEYEFEIKSLKSKLKDTIITLKETVNSNAEHIGKHEQVISQLKYSLFQQQDVEEILIESSLEPQSDYNPLEWDINDCLDWLQMINLSQLTEIFKINNINGNILLNNIYYYNKQQFIHILKLKNNKDIEIFMNELNILKQTSPQIYNPNNIETSSVSSTDTIITNNIIKLQQTHNVTLHSLHSLHSHHTEINKLKSEINRIKSSKLQLIVNTSSELQKLRDIIKKCNCIKFVNLSGTR